MHFPAELYRSVIDNLYDDKASLRACSLTCRAFLPECRYHLFYHVDLYNRSVAKRFLDIICSDSSTVPTTFIRELSIFEGRGRSKFETPWVNDALPLLTTFLFDVTTLELDAFEWSLLDDAGRTMLLLGFQKVTHLLLLFGDFGTSQDMNRFIASFPSLTNFSCCQTRWVTRSVYPTSCISLPQTLTSISLESSHAYFFSRLLRLESRPIVRELDIQDICLDDVHSAGLLLRTIGPNLEHLALQGCRVEAVLHNDMNITHNTNLRSIDLDCGSIYEKYPPRSMGWVFELINQISSPHLESIMFRFQLDTVADLDTVDWVQIEEFFMREQWPNLRKLKIFLYTSNTVWPAIAKSIQARLPILDGYGFLHVLQRGTVEFLQELPWCYKTSPVFQPAKTA